MSLLAKDTLCPRPDCAGIFRRTYADNGMKVATDTCTVCNYAKKTILSGHFAGHIEYFKDGERVKFTDER